MAASDGLFAPAGLGVRVIAGPGDADALAVVVADENTIGIASAPAFLKARSEGLPIVAFSTTTNLRRRLGSDDVR